MGLKKKNDTAENVVDNGLEENNSTATENSAPTLDASLTDPTNPKYKYVIKNKKARMQSKERKIVIIILILLLVLALVGMSIYGFYSALEVNNFSIFVQNDGSRILSLSSSPDFSNGTQYLEVGGPEYMDNTSIYLSPLGDVPIEEKILEIAEGEGQMSGKEDKYIAFSFYLKNITTDKQYYNEIFKIADATQGMEKALRVMLIQDYDVTVYATPASDGQPEKVVPTTLPENAYSPLEFVTNEDGTRSVRHNKDAGIWYTTPFHGDDYVFYNKGHELNPGQTVKYSLIIWMEGWDPDCVNEIIGGKLKIEFAFEVAPTP